MSDGCMYFTFILDTDVLRSCWSGDTVQTWR